MNALLILYQLANGSRITPVASRLIPTIIAGAVPPTARPLPIPCTQKPARIRYSRCLRSFTIDNALPDILTYPLTGRNLYDANLWS